MVQGYLFFHLNLAFSSISTEARPDVISKCYWPLLDLAEDTGIPVGIELTGWTLKQIALLDQSWVDRFRRMLECRQCELIGSGWAQIIGPLVPYQVNRLNQKLGIEAYRQILGVTPRLALVNEMTFSTSMVDVYDEAGYKGIVMDRDNVRLALGLDKAPLSVTPTHALGCSDQSLPVLWSDSILFQRLQRVVHGDISIAEYMDYVKQRANDDHAVLPIYGNDAEIFDYRPNRFTTESRMHPESEWKRFRQVCSRLQKDLELTWLEPSQTLEIQSSTPSKIIHRLTSVSQPIPVKKQAKYNVSRWAVTGRDDLWLNTACHQIQQAILESGDVSSESWRELCELWASDLRTHITDLRWQEALQRISLAKSRLGIDQAYQRCYETESIKAKQNKRVQIEHDEENFFWIIKTADVQLVLNARRGLTMRSLAFKSHDFKPIIGTLPQGHFKTIELGADFYSGGALIEIPGERIRLTDLEWVNPDVELRGKELVISADLPFGTEVLHKTIVVDMELEKIKLSYDFNSWIRPLGVVRVGLLTLMPETFAGDLTVKCVNGGDGMESFVLDQDINYGRSASMLVSSSAALGCTNGRIILEDAVGTGFQLSWSPSKCAALPMLQHVASGRSHLTRFWFSLVELDDTSCAGGSLLPFELEITNLKK